MRFLTRLLLIFLGLVVVYIPAEASSTSLVISQVYLGTGGTATKPQYQYVELFNKGTTAVNISTWSLQYAVESVNTWQAFPLTGTIGPGQYFEIQLTGRSGGFVTFPAGGADLTINLTLPQDTGKVALANVTTALDTGCPTDSRVVDLVGYGNTTCFEGRAVSSPASSDVLSLMRKAGGCIDSDLNASDFLTATPVFRKTISARNPCNGTSGTRAFSLAAGGGDSFQSSGSASAPFVSGFARILPNSNSVAPAGVAIYGLRQSGTLISETGVPASPLVTEGLTYAEVNGAVNTGLAIANRNSDNVTINFAITDQNDVTHAFSGSFVIAGNSQMANFVTDWPFNSPAITGILTFSASEPVSVVALRGYTNERNEFLVSTLPVLDQLTPTTTAPGYVPQFAVGGGWRTELVLMNPVDVPISGTVTFTDSSGNAVSLPVGTLSPQSSVSYTVPNSRTIKFVFPNTSPTLQRGVMKITPISGAQTPIILGVFSYSPANVRVAEASIIGVQGTQLRIYAETSNVGSVGSIQTGLAVANISGVPANVTVEAVQLNGTSTGMTSTFTIPATGELTKFADDIFPSLSSFRGILRVSSNTTVAVLGVRGRINERKEFLVATLPIVQETTQGSSAEQDFPDIADAGGYTTQFVLIEAVTGQTSIGTVGFRTTGGQLLDLTLQ
jgi:hypothetical protein